LPFLTRRQVVICYGGIAGRATSGGTCNEEISCPSQPRRPNLATNISSRMPATLSLKIILVAALCVGSVIGPARATDFSRPTDSAAYILGHLEGTIEFLTECADYDKQNADGYADIISRYVKENKNLTDRLMTIMCVEWVRTGHTLEALSKYLSNSKKRGAERARKMRQENPNFLNRCRAHWEAHKKGLAVYSLSEKFPDKMRVIDEWKTAPSGGCNYATATSPIMAAR